jgi:hypothetical protein
MKNIKKCADIRENIPTRHPRQNPDAKTGKKDILKRKNAGRQEICVCSCGAGIKKSSSPPFARPKAQSTI